MPLAVDLVPLSNLFAVHHHTKIRRVIALAEIDVLIDELILAHRDELRDGGGDFVGGGEHDGAGGGVGEGLFYRVRIYELSLVVVKIIKQLR
jgi:hypothetical protein